jgi:molecular chaperone DnaK
VPQIEVTFDIDANGIVNVKAVDKGTNREQKVTITSSTGLTDTEIEKMRQEAEAHSEEDKKKKELVEARNDADNLIYTAERTLKEVKDANKNVKPEDLRAVEDAVTELKSVRESEELDKIKEKWSALSDKLQVVGAAMYQQSGPEGAETKPEEPIAEEPKTDAAEEPK